MSNQFAIAQATATLNWVLQQAANADLSGIGSVTVTNVRPDQIDRSKLGINVFLYQATPNAAGRNADAPTRRADKLVQKPCAALDLHYLLSFYGDEPSLQPQLLLASTVRTLHAQPVLDRATIKKALEQPAVHQLHGAAGTDLDAAPDLLRFTPTALSLEELTKLWSGFVLQTTYLLSTAYQASIVFLDGDGDVNPTAKPVKEPVVHAAPEIETLLSVSPPSSPLP